MFTKTTLVVAGTGLALLGAGAAHAASGPAGGPVTTHPHLSLTQADNGRTITIPTGVDVSVDLSTPGQGQWSAPTASSSAVLHTNGSFSKPDGGAHTSFLSDAVGTSKVTAVESFSPAQVVVPFGVTIVVVAR